MVYSGLVLYNGQYWLYGLFETESNALHKTLQYIRGADNGSFVGTVRVAETTGYTLKFINSR